ncbi:MAG TPA: ROK family protein [Herpetosiphonaceae bacterium]
MALADLHQLPGDEALVVEAIRQRGPLSRTDLAEISGCSRAKMTTVAANLLAKGILIEVGAGDSQGGRRPRLLNFNPNQGYVVGVDMGATSIDLALADLTGAILERHSEPADVRDGPAVLLERITAIINQLLARRRLDPSQVTAMGLGVPGPVEFSSGRLVSPPLMPAWDRFPIPATLQAAFPRSQVIVDNDANVMALGELVAGAGQGIDHFFLVKIGTGIGAGIICNGAVHRGSDGCAGDIGHICADRNGPICHCGKTGCLEAIAAGPALAARALELAETGRSPILASRLALQGQLSAADLGAAAAAGDRAALELIQDSGRLIGEALAGLVNFFNPRLIVITGGVSLIGHQLLASLKQAVLQRSLPLSTKGLRIDYGALGLDAGLRGALTLAIKHAFGPGSALLRS